MDGDRSVLVGERLVVSVGEKLMVVGEETFS